MRFKFSVATLVKVSVFTLVAIFLTVLLGMKIANTGLFADTYTLEAEFANASGVFPGDAVKLAGVDVGRVESTRIENGRAVVEFNVDREVALPSDSTIGIRWRNVIGLRFLYLYPGEAAEFLEDGDRIPVEQTEDAGDIGAFLNELGPVLRAIDPEEANAFLHAMNQALSGNEATVRLLLDSGANLATELGSIDRQIKSLIGSSDEAVAIYARQSDDVGRLIDDLDAVGGKLAGMTDAINSLLVNFSVVQEELDELLSENRGNIDATLSGLLDISRLLKDNRYALERTLCTLPAGIVSYDQTSSWGEWFNVRIVEFVVKDEQSREIASFGELDEQRGDRDPRPVAVCPRGAVVRTQLTEQQAHGSLGGPNVGPEETRLPGWLDTITGGGGG